MAVLVTRPLPDGEATAAGLRARGFEVLPAPMLRFEPFAFHDDGMPLWRRHRHQRQCAARRSKLHLAGQPPAEAAAVCGRRTYRRRGARRRLCQGDLGRGRRGGLARSRARKREGEEAEEGTAAALSGRRRSRARSCRRTRRTAVLGRHPDHLPDGSRPRACRARSSMPLRPARSRRCCIIPGAARAPLSMRRGPAVWKYRRWRCRNAAFPRPWPRSSATPAPPRSRWRRRRTKMPYSRP